jgi:hypothetical protein
MQEKQKVALYCCLQGKQVQRRGVRLVGFGHGPDEIAPSSQPTELRSFGDKMQTHGHLKYAGHATWFRTILRL